MQTKVFDGRAAAQKIKEKLKKEALAKGLKPRLAVLLVGENPASLSYINQKKKASEELGWGFELHSLPASSTFENVRDQLSILNSQFSIDGIILQLPLPAYLKTQTAELIKTIDPTKDIDGLTDHSLFIPPTAQAVLYVLTESKIKIDRAKVVVLGRGQTAGAPVAKLLKEKGANVFVANSKTEWSLVIGHLSSADIIVSCVGKPNLITGEMIKPGAIVIGVGLSQLKTNNSQQTTYQGDIDEKSLMGRASLITPTPGGIGPLTVAFLLKNLMRACQESGRD